MHRGGRGDCLREGTYLAIVDGNQKKKIFFPIVSVGHQFFSKNPSTPENKKKKKIGEWVLARPLGSLRVSNHPCVFFFFLSSTKIQMHDISAISLGGGVCVCVGGGDH